MDERGREGGEGGKWERDELIYGDGEEALDLGGVEVHGDLEGGLVEAESKVLRSAVAGGDSQHDLCQPLEGDLPPALLLLELYGSNLAANRYEKIAQKY